MQNKFTPSELGVISSSAFAYTLVELIAYWLTLYIFNLSATMKLLDLLAFSGYKFVAINLCILVSIVFKSFGYYLALLYTGFSLCFFLVSLFKDKVKQIHMRTTAFHASNHFIFCVISFTVAYVEGKDDARIGECCFV